LQHLPFAARIEVVEDTASVRLSSRERKVLQVVATGATNRQVARSLGISPKTVEYHLAAVYRTLGAANRVEAVETARHAGLL
jgi:two-component system response regulator DesR